jgi:hypothetical protein
MGYDTRYSRRHSTGLKPRRSALEKNLFEEDSPPNNVLEVGIPDDLRNFSTRGKLEMRLTTVRYPARESRIIDAALVRVDAIVVVDDDVMDTIEAYAGSQMTAAIDDARSGGCSSATFFLQTTLSTSWARSLLLW